MTIMSNDETLRTLLSTHPAVHLAGIKREGEVRLAFVAPDAHRAPLLCRTCRVEDDLPPGLHVFEPAGRMPFVGINKTEAEFLYDEILVRDCYGIAGDPALPARPTVIDIGANIGIFSITVGRRFPGARILAIEPVPVLCSAIRLNADLHGVDVAVANLAASDADGPIDVQYFPSNTVMSGIRLQDASAEETLRAYLLRQNPEIEAEDLAILLEECLVPQTIPARAARLTDILAQHRIDRVDLLKIDAEHSELPVLRGIAASSWAAIDRIVVEVHDVDGRLDAVTALLSEHGFTLSRDDRDLEATGCWMIAGRRAGCGRAPADPRPLGTEMTKQRLLAELAALLREHGEPPPDRIFVTLPERIAEAVGACLPSEDRGRAGARHSDRLRQREG